MLSAHRINDAIKARNFVWIGISVAIFYWLLESFIHVIFFGGTRFTEELITPDPHEIWKRLLVVGLLVLFGVFAQQYFSQRERSEKALKESEKKYRTIFEEAMNPIFLFDHTGQFIDNNRAALKFLGYTQKELENKTFHNIAAGHSLPNFIDKPASDNEQWIMEIDYPAKPHTKTMVLNLVPLSNEANSFIYGIGQDISGRKRMERVTKQAFAELDQIFQTASVGMRVIDKNFNVMKINKTFAVMTGLTEAAAADKKCYEIFSGPMCHTAQCPIVQIQKGKTHFEAYVDKTCMDGKIIPSILTATPFTGTDGEVIGIVESFRDITQLKEANEIIHSERDKLHRILSHLLEGVCIVNTDHTIEYQNEVLKKTLGDCEGKKCYAVFRARDLPCSPCLMQEAIQNSNVQHVEYESLNGQFYEQAYTKITDIDGKEKVVTLLSDVTEKKRSLAAAMHAEQLAAIGELAAGVAHEINNPINGIINYAQIILNKNKSRDLVSDIAHRMIKEGNRIARIVEGLLSFSRRTHKEKTTVSVQQVLSDALTLTAAQLRKDSIIVNTGLAENLPPILAQPHEIEQVIVNIISNARHALNEKYPALHTNKILDITAAPVRCNGRLHVRVCFKDQGIGIPADVIKKVMNPFFTTKTEGKRTGLGLSISHGIVEEHRGRLSLESEENRYTKVIMELPGHLQEL